MSDVGFLNFDIDAVMNTQYLEKMPNSLLKSSRAISLPIKLSQIEIGSFFSKKFQVETSFCRTLVSSWLSSQSRQWD